MDIAWEEKYSWWMTIYHKFVRDIVFFYTLPKRELWSQSVVHYEVFSVRFQGEKREWGVWIVFKGFKMKIVHPIYMLSTKTL